MKLFIRDQLLSDGKTTKTAGEWAKYFASRIKKAALIKAEEPGEFRGGDPEEMRLKKEEKQTELGESGDAGEDQGGEEPDPADVEEAQQADQNKSEEKSVSIGKAITTAMGAVEASPWPPNTTDYPSKDRNGNPVHDNVDFHFRGVKQPWIEVGPPRQGPNQKKPWSEVLGLPPLMAPSGPPYWRQKLLQERRDELGMSPRPRLIEPTDMYATQSMVKAFDDLLEKAKRSLKVEPSHRKGLVPCPYGGGIECLRHGGDGADSHYSSFHHKHEDQPQSHEDVLHQEAGKDPGERTHSLNQMQKKALVGHVMSRYESEGTDLDNPDTRSKYMKTLRHIHGYLGKDAESNAWRKKAISEWKSKINQYHGSEDQKPEGHLAMEAAEKQIDVTCDFSREVGWGSTDSKESDLPEKMLEQAFGRQMRISDFERAYTVDDDNLKLPTPDGGYGANIHHINIVEKEQGQYEINVMGSIDYSYGEGSERAATFVRVIHCSVGGKKKQDRFIMVHHDKIFVLDADHSKVGGHQNSGLSTDFLKHSVIEYQKWGVNQITTSPHWVGKYTWARMGFQWNEEAAATVGRHMTKFLISHYGMEKEAAAKLAAKFADMPSRFAVKTLSNPQLTEDGQALFRSFEKSEYRCKPEEVGKAFLLSDGGNQVWMNGGMVDMSRKTSPSYRQLRKYLGLK